MASKVAEIIQGVVLLKTPDELGWTLFLQSRDATEISMWCCAKIHLQPIDERTHRRL